MSKSGLFTSSGRLLIRIKEQPGVTIRELAEDMFLTKRTMWGGIGELRHLGYLTVEKDGRTHHYYVSPKGLSAIRGRLTDD